MRDFLDERRDFGSSRINREFVSNLFSSEEGKWWNSKSWVDLLFICLICVYFILFLFICVFNLFDSKPPHFYCFCFVVIVDQTRCKFVGETTQVPYFCKSFSNLVIFGETTISFKICRRCRGICIGLISNSSVNNIVSVV